MIRICSVLCPTVLLLLLAAPAVAQHRFIQSGFAYNPQPASPAALSWRLATQSGEFVELVVPPATYTSNQIAHQVTPLNASDYGLDFAAWAAAVNDPIYNRSIVSFGGVVQEEPWSNQWAGTFELDAIGLIVNDFSPRYSFSTVLGEVADLVPVPEPATWLMACTIALHLFARRRSRPVP
jgi:hypothetical protein